MRFEIKTKIYDFDITFAQSTQRLTSTGIRQPGLDFYHT